MSESSVVRIFATTQAPDYDSPWQSQNPSSATGSGVVLSKGRVLTGAHVVANATFLQVQKVSDPNRYVAKLVGVCHDCDLALLRIDDPRFHQGAEVASLGGLPQLRDRVSVVGFPLGGQEVSVTEGVVSRIEASRYTHSQRHLLAVTVDAAINEGNSGGPVFMEGEVVGIAFQTLSDADNIGEMVPTNLIRRFLEGLKQNRAIEIPSLSLRTQTLENPLLKKAYGLKPDDSGVLVRAVDFGGTAFGKIKPEDVLHTIGGYRIESNGTILYKDRIRTRFDVLMGDHYVGDEVEVTISRRGVRKRVVLELKRECCLVPRKRYERRPTYFLFGGLVFQTLTRNFLETWSNWWEKAPPEFLEYYYTGLRLPERQEIIVLSHVLADELTVGYEDHYNESIVTVNGSRPRDMRDLVERIENSKQLIEVGTSCGAKLVFDGAAVRKAKRRIMQRYRIAQDRSPDLKLAPTRKKSARSRAKRP